VDSHAATKPPEQVEATDEVPVHDAVHLQARETARSGLRVLTVYGLRIAGAGVGFVAQIALARWLSAAEYGIYANIMVWLMLIGGWLSLGLGAAMMRFVPEYKALARFDLLRGLRRLSLGVAFSLSSLIALIAIAVLSQSGDSIAPTYHKALFYAAFCLPFLALTEVNDGFCRGNGWPVRGMAPSLLLRPVMLVAGVAIAIAVYGRDATAEDAMALMLVAVAATAVVQAFVARHGARESIGLGSTEYSMPSWLGVAIPLVMVEGLLHLMNNVDIVLVGALLPAENVGHYYAATRILMLVGFVPVAVIAVMAPRFAHFAATDDHDGLARAVNQAVTLSFWPAAIMALGIVAAGPLLLAAFGTSFSAAYPALIILTVSAVARSAIAPAQTMLVMTGHQRTGMAILGAAVIANAGFNLVMIPAFGITGAALATATAMLLELLLSTIVIRRNFGFQPVPTLDIGQLRALLRSVLARSPMSQKKCQEV